jgi:branched-chain amino acid transport system ATP-binding protein
LSYGQRKLLDLAIAIIKPHTLLMLDEPVAGVNPKIREIIKDILRNLIRKGETILLIEHDMNFTMDLASYIYVLDAGKVISQGKPTVVRKDKRVLEAYLGN